MKTRLPDPSLSAPLWACLGLALALGRPVLLVLLGFAAWPVLEYALHRWGYHRLRTQWFEWYNLLHGRHHRDPQAVENYGLPSAAVLAAAVAGLLLLPLGVIGGLLIGYGIAVWVHLGAHGRLPLPDAFGRWVIAHHMEHHKDPAGNFSIVAPFLDSWFSTRCRPLPPGAAIRRALQPWMDECDIVGLVNHGSWWEVWVAGLNRPDPAITALKEMAARLPFRVRVIDANDEATPGGDLVFVIG